MKTIRHRRPSPLTCGVLAALVLLASARGEGLAAIVVANRSKAAVQFKVVGENGPARDYSLAPADLVTLAADVPVTVEFESDKQTQRKKINPYSAWFFHTAKGPLQLTEIELPPPNFADQPDDRPAVAKASLAGSDLLTIKVKLLVDEEERAARPRWEARLRGRLKTASGVFEKYARVRFQPVEIAVWKSDNDLIELDDALLDFEKQAPAAPADLAVGFSSQYEIPQGRVMLGGTHGPLRSHILLREWSQHVSERERMEMLVHELAHYLGAVHSPEGDSVMRPLLGDRQAASRQFRVRLDPLNTLAVCLVADELRRRPVRQFSDLGRHTRHRLAGIYTLLARVLPEDPAASQFLALVDPRAPEVRRPIFRQPDAQPAAPPRRDVAMRPGIDLGGLSLEPAAPLPAAEPTDDAGQQRRLIASTREVLRAVVGAAQENQLLPLGRQAAHEDLYRRDGDRLTEHYVAVAARAAALEPTLFQRQSFLLALAIAVDSDHWLRGLPLVGDFLREIEPDVERAHRLEWIGSPTLYDRHDLAQHFCVAAAITSLAGRKGAEMAGLAKELRDADGGSGFSFCDWAADLAGIALADKLATEELSLVQLANRFRVSDFVPSVANLPEGLKRSQFEREFGSPADERFKEIDGLLRQRIADLPAYRPR